MKLRQGRNEENHEGHSGRSISVKVGSAALFFAVGTETELKAYAAEWQQAENGDWTLQRRR